MAAVAADESDITFLGIAGRADESEITEATTRLGIDGFEHAIDDSGAIWVGFDVTSQPAFAFVDDDGTVEIHRGAMSEDELRERIAELRAS